MIVTTTTSSTHVHTDLEQNTEVYMQGSSILGKKPKSWKSGLRPLKDGLGSVFRKSRSPSPQPPSKGSTTAPAGLQTTEVSLPDATPAIHSPAPIRTVTSSTSEKPYRDHETQVNDYTAMGGLPIVAVVPDAGSVAYEGFKATIQAIYECSDMFTPLKTALGVFVNLSRIVDAVLGNQEELRDLQAKLKAILSIVEKYRKHGGLRALDHRIRMFCEAITLQIESVEMLQSNSLVTRTAQSTKDAETILKVFRHISSLCDVFQIDTELNTEATVESVNETVKGILQHFNLGSIDKLLHDMTSYKTRHTSYGDPSGCMPGTRLQLLADLEAWSAEAASSKIYWLAGMAGTGKSSISHSLCEILEAKNMLGGSFFCSRASENARNARLIIPTIAHALAIASPYIRSEVVKAIENDPKLAEPTYGNMHDQFKKLIYHPLRTFPGPGVRTYKVVVIDAVDECTDLRFVSSLLRLILESSSAIPLKFFIASRPEDLIYSAFYSHPEFSTAFQLHEVEKHVVEDDIRKYIETSLLEIKSLGLDHTQDAWPAPAELSNLASHSGRLFIYPATAIRYIRDGGKLFKSRLAVMANQDPQSGSKLQTSIIDSLYAHILEQACACKEENELTPMRQLVSMVVFLRNPLPIDAITSLADIDAQLYLSPFASVIHIPTDELAPVAPFHASFPDFVSDPTRCSPDRCPSFAVLTPSEGHGVLTLNCLVFMNHSLMYNVCNAPVASTVSRQGTANAPGNISRISEALKYSCIYWASHLAAARQPGDDVIRALSHFLHNHLLHWVETLSVLGELQTGLKSLGSAAAALSSFSMTDIRCHDLRLLVDDARRCLHMNFEGIQKNAFEIYQSALVWIPKQSLLREVYAGDVRKVPKVVYGLSKSWGPIELVMQNGSGVHSAAFSPDGSQVVSGSLDRVVRIWNSATGEVEAELKGHKLEVRCVAFSSDGSRVISCSDDGTIRIWNARTGEVERELKGHTEAVDSVTITQDGSRIVSGSSDATVRIWTTTTGELEAILEGHTGSVNSVAVSQDGRQVASGSTDNTARIWDMSTGVALAKLAGHSAQVNSVAFSQDGSQLVSGSSDYTVRIWNARTGEVKAVLNGHTANVNSVAFSPDSSRVVSGSSNRTLRIWNAESGALEVELKGHTYAVSVAFSQDGSRIVTGSYDDTIRIWNVATAEADSEAPPEEHAVNSVAFSADAAVVSAGSEDGTIRIWDATTGEVEVELKGHTASISCVLLSQDCSLLASASYDKTIRIWNVATGELAAVLEGHADWVNSVAFSKDGSHLVSGSHDTTVRIWDVTTGKLEHQLEGHKGPVTAVAFSPTSSQVISGSFDKTIRIWNATTGVTEMEMKGHTDVVTSVAFSMNGTQIVSGSDDDTVRIWNPATGTSDVMTASSITLPDLTRVERAFTNEHHRDTDRLRRGIFYIVQPALQQPTLGVSRAAAISDDGHWILSTHRDCWIPPGDRNYTAFSFSTERVCFGYKSGRVVILDMALSIP